MRSTGRQRAIHDVANVARQPGIPGDPPQGRFGLGTSHRLERAPAAKRRHQASCDLRIFGVEREHAVGHEVVTGSVATVELRLVGLRKGTDQAAHAVRIAKRERLVGGERAHVAASGIAACNDSHLSMTSASDWWRA